ncbi:MAG: glycosyltransferase family 39 protein, partial [Sphingobacteriaceae bacterium]|nr:glycosyltransferase family 39 protein [Cytophagaceae bacterium]
MASEKSSIPNFAPTPTFWWIALGVLLLTQILFRSHLLSIPFERDEGEYAYLGQLVLQGVPPFQDAANMKLPGTNLMYALFMVVFGQSVWGIHLGLLCMSLGTMTLLYLAFRRFYNPLVGILAVGLYSLMSLSIPVLGFAAHATHFIVFFMAAGWLALVYFAEKPQAKQAFIAGLLFGLSFLMKQQALFYVAFGGLFILATLYFQKKLTVASALPYVSRYLAGVALPYLLLVLWLVASGTFGAFWFWTVQYASSYAGGAEAKSIPTLFGQAFFPLFTEFPLFWILGLAGFRILFWGNYTPFQKTIALLFGALSLVSVLPGFYFRYHYTILFLPALGLLFALSLDVAVQHLTTATRYPFWPFLPLGLFVLVGLTFYADNEGYLNSTPPEGISRQVYTGNAFAESPRIARYIQQRTLPTDKIAVLGSEPQLFVYSGRRSATRHIYTYGLMEDQPYNLRMQEEMILDIEKAKPKFIVYYGISASWIQRVRSPLRIFQWSDQYLTKNYVLSGAADVRR